MAMVMFELKFYGNGGLCPALGRSTQYTASVLSVSVLRSLYVSFAPALIGLRPSAQRKRMVNSSGIRVAVS